MKTRKNYLILLMVLSVVLIFASCKKELGGAAVTNSYIGPAVQTAGAIVDIGAVDSTVHHMIVTLNDVSVSMYGQPMGTTVESSKVEIDLYTNSDAFVQDGTYYYSGSTEAAPFTFKSASIMMPNSDTNYIDSYVLSGGAITLSRTGTAYAISFDGNLENGNSFQGSFNGDLSYVDLLATSKKK
jgi:hypothetical protein